MKLWTTEAGFRVAGIMRWPAGISGGQTVQHAVSALDFIPTFCELAETEVLEDLELDGEGFLPALENKPITRDNPLIWAYYNAINEHRVAMRSDQWKVLAKLDFPKLQNGHSGNINEVRAAQLSDVQVYDIANDIGEVTNLSGKHQQLKEELTNKLTNAYNDLVEGSHVWELVHTQ